jgi:hypothetical protein
LTLIAAADRFRARSVESAPRPHLKTAPTALKKMDRVDTRTFSTESAKKADVASGIYCIDTQLTPMREN